MFFRLAAWLMVIGKWPCIYMALFYFSTQLQCHIYKLVHSVGSTEQLSSVFVLWHVVHVLVIKPLTLCFMDNTLYLLSHSCPNLSCISIADITLSALFALNSARRRVMQFTFLSLNLVISCWSRPLSWDFWDLRQLKESIRESSRLLIHRNLYSDPPSPLFDLLPTRGKKKGCYMKLPIALSKRF